MRFENGVLLWILIMMLLLGFELLPLQAVSDAGTYLFGDWAGDTPTTGLAIIGGALAGLVLTLVLLLRRPLGIVRAKRQNILVVTPSSAVMALGKKVDVTDLAQVRSATFAQVTRFGFESPFLFGIIAHRLVGEGWRREQIVLEMKSGPRRTFLARGYFGSVQNIATVVQRKIQAGPQSTGYGNSHLG